MVLVFCANYLVKNGNKDCDFCLLSVDNNIEIKQYSYSFLRVLLNKYSNYVKATSSDHQVHCKKKIPPCSTVKKSNLNLSPCHFYSIHKEIFLLWINLKIGTLSGTRDLLCCNREHVTFKNTVNSGTFMYSSRQYYFITPSQAMTKGIQQFYWNLVFPSKNCIFCASYVVSRDW